MKAWFIRGPAGPMPCRKMVAASIGRFGIVQRVSMVGLDLAQVSEDSRVLESRAQHSESRGRQVGQRVRDGTGKQGQERAGRATTKRAKPDGAAQQWSLDLRGWLGTEAQYGDSGTRAGNVEKGGAEEESSRGSGVL